MSCMLVFCLGCSMKKSPGYRPYAALQIRAIAVSADLSESGHDDGIIGLNPFDQQVATVGLGDDLLVAQQGTQLTLPTPYGHQHQQPPRRARFLLLFNIV